MAHTSRNLEQKLDYILDANNQTSEWGGVAIGGSGGSEEIEAQTFKALTTEDIYGIELEFYIYQDAQLANITVELRTIDGEGKPTSTILTSKSISCDVFLDEIVTKKLFIFASPVELTAGTTYAIVVKGTCPLTNYIFLSNNRTGGDVYADGKEWRSTDGGSSWAEQTDKDLYFKVFVYGSGDIITIIENGEVKEDLAVANGKTIGGLNPSLAIIKNNVSGTFTTNDGKTITVVDGQITAITT